MTTDISRAQRIRRLEAKRVAREAYVNAFSWDISVTWPRGILAKLWALTLMLTPVGYLMLWCFLFRRRRGVHASWQRGRPDGAA